jgi:predicted transcriptional regulator of viral defense system
MRDEVRTRWSGEAIWALVTRQHGVVAHAQLIAHGVSPQTIWRWVRTGRVRQLHRGVYMVGHGAITQRGWWMGAVLAGGEGAALSHRPAARLHELIAWHPGRPAVSVPARRTPRRPGIALHRIATIEPVVVDGIPSTPVARTIVDMAAISRRRTLEKVVEEATVREVFDLTAIDRVLDGIVRPRGVRLLRSVLADFQPGTTRTRSELEEAMLALCRRAGVPEPLANLYVALLDGTLVQVDFHWPRRRVIVEMDSNRYHATHPKRRRDRGKDRALQLAGWLVLRFPEEELAERPDRLLADLRAALGG